MKSPYDFEYCGERAPEDCQYADTYGDELLFRATKTRLIIWLKNERDYAHQGEKAYAELKTRHESAHKALHVLVGSAHVSQPQQVPTAEHPSPTPGTFQWAYGLLKQGVPVKLATWDTAYLYSRELGDGKIEILSTCEVMFRGFHPRMIDATDWEVSTLIHEGQTWQDAHGHQHKVLMVKHDRVFFESTQSDGTQVAHTISVEKFLKHYAAKLVAVED